MADVRVIDNTKRSAGDELIESLQWATDVRIATAFAMKSGVARLITPLEDVLSRGGTLTVVYGLDFHTTDPEAMNRFLRLAESHPSVAHYVYSDWALSTRQTFHPKLYICSNPQGDVQVLVGSSNLSGGGLWTNVEASALISGTANEPPIVDANAVFGRILGTEGLFRPDREYIDDYRRLRKKAALAPLTAEPPPELADEYKEFKRREFRLPGSRPTQTRLVIEAIKRLGDKDGWVHLRDIYREAEHLARESKAEFDWDTFKNSIRGRINEHTLGRGDDLFERSGGVQGRQGIYRLTDAGHSYDGR